MIWAVVTRWLTHGTVLRGALELRPALDTFCELSDWNKILKKSVWKFKLDALEWEFIVQLKPILMVCVSFFMLFHVLICVLDVCRHY